MDCLNYMIDSNDVDNYGICLEDVYEQTRNNTIKNCVIRDFIEPLHVEGTNNNTILNNTILSSTYGLHVLQASNNTLINNTISNCNMCIWLEEAANNTAITNNLNGCGRGYYLSASNTANNNITGGSVKDSSNNDYYLYDIQANNMFTENNFTATRKIYFQSEEEWFNYNNETDGNIWLKTNVSERENITRKLISWSNITMKWNDTSNETITARYNITGLDPDTEYNIYNNSIFVQTLTTDSSGNLPSFTIEHDATEREIWVEKYQEIQLDNCSILDQANKVYKLNYHH